MALPDPAGGRGTTTGGGGGGSAGSAFWWLVALLLGATMLEGYRAHSRAALMKALGKVRRGTRGASSIEHSAEPAPHDAHHARALALRRWKVRLRLSLGARCRRQLPGGKLVFGNGRDSGLGMLLGSTGASPRAGKLS